MEPDLARAPQRGEEKALAAEERCLDAADQLDVVLHRWLEADDAARVHAKRLARGERALQQGAAGVDKGPAVAGQPLHDETLAAEQTHPEPFLEGDADAHALGRAEKGILLHDQLAAEIGQAHRNDLAGVGCAEGELPLPDALVLEDGHEERFAGEQAFAGAEQRAHEAGVLRRAVTEDGLHGNMFVHIHHAARLGHDGLLWIELDLDELHFGAVDHIVNFVH